MAHKGGHNPEHLEILLQGRDVWNKWRKDNPHIKPYLCGIELCGADLGGANLSRVNLILANLSGAGLIGVNLSGADLRGANLSGADLIEANLSGARLWKANLSDTSLSEAQLSGAHLLWGNLSGAHLRKANLSDANLLNANLSGTNLFEANLSGADLRRADFSSLSKLSEAVSGKPQVLEQTNTDLTKADLRQAKLQGANFENAILTNVRYQGGSAWNVLEDYAHWLTRRKIKASPHMPPLFDNEKERLWAQKWLRVFYPIRVFLYLWRCRGCGMMRDCYEGVNAAECWGNAAFRRDAMDQDYIDQLRSRFRWHAVYGPLIWAWGWFDYGRSFLRVFLISFLIICGFGLFYTHHALMPCDLGAGVYGPCAGAQVEYTPNIGVFNGFTPYYVAAVTFSTLGFTDIAVPKTFLGQVVLMANAMFGYIVFGVLLSILANVVARRAGG